MTNLLNINANFQPVRGIIRDLQTGNIVDTPVFANQCIFENKACDFNRRRGRRVLIRDENQHNVHYPSIRQI